jgi:uncharacterized lipoprotein NlpE involved in copper resistance
MKIMKSRKSVGAALALSVLLVALLGCHNQDGPAERAGKKIDKATEQAAKKIDKAVEKVGEKVEKTGEKIQDAVRDDKK